MRLLSMWMVFAALTACASNSRPASDDSLPAGVVAAFTAEHPYAKVHNASEKTSKDGVETYTVPYTRPDGTEGAATYSEAGVLLDDKK